VYAPIVKTIRATVTMASQIEFERARSTGLVAMPVERTAGGTSLVDVLDRVLDKGIVIDAWVRVSLVGIDLITEEARVVVASIDTYLKYAEAVGQVSTASRPALETTTADVLIADADLIDRERVLRKRPVRRLRRKRASTT